MFRYINLFGNDISVYDICFALALLTIPIFFFSFRKRFNFTIKQTLFYVIFTLGFGLLSARITALIKDYLLSIDSNGAYESIERLRNYGIPIFLPLFFLIYCILFRDKFRTLTDYLAPGVYSVMTFVKLGCIFAGCCYGAPDEHGIMNDYLGYRTFPVQLYDMLTSIFIVIVCVILILTLHKKHKGYIYPIGGMLFAITKGFWENFRSHESVWEQNFFNTGWTLWQFWMLILFIGCFCWMIFTIILEKNSFPDFDNMPNLKIPQIKLPDKMSNIKNRENNTKQKKRKK